MGIQVLEKLSTNLQIIIFTRSLPFHRIGGMEIIVWNLAKSFSKKGHSVEIITTKIPEKKDEFVEDGIKIVPIKNTSSGKYSLRWWHYSRQYLKKKKPLKNLVILSVSIAGVSLLNLKKFKNTPILCQAHGTSWGEAISKWKTKNVISVLKSIKNIMYLPIDIFFLPYFSKIIAIGPDVEDNLKKFPYFLAPHKIIRINNGIDRSLFVPSKNNRKNFRKENNISEDTVLIVSVCRIHEQKGVDNIIESFHIYNKKNQNSLLIIIGEGPYKKEIIQRCDLLKISEKVIFFGNCNQDEIALVLQSADIVYQLKTDL